MRTVLELVWNPQATAINNNFATAGVPCVLQKALGDSSYIISYVKGKTEDTVSIIMLYSFSIPHLEVWCPCSVSRTSGVLNEDIWQTISLIWLYLSFYNPLLLGGGCGGGAAAFSECLFEMSEKKMKPNKCAYSGINSILLLVCSGCLIFRFGHLWRFSLALFSQFFNFPLFGCSHSWLPAAAYCLLCSLQLRLFFLWKVSASVADITYSVFKYLPLRSFKNVWDIAYTQCFFITTDLYLQINDSIYT